ncbi:MAG: mnhB [Solirubrobacterales bacterium]|jgi:multicomponent Na+:H+ antiporter subunit B|nr:mnhB [Solirubrobacterales bacterium]
MSLAVRRRVFLVAAAGFGALIVWGLTGLPDFGVEIGHLGTRIAHAAVPERHVTAAVSAINFDYRAFDTLGEEFILFTAAAGVALLLRSGRGERERPHIDASPDRQVPETSDLVRVFGVGLIGFTLLLGLYVVFHGHLTPGGGFQGGVVLAAAVLVVYLAGEWVSAGRLRPVAAMEALEATGAAGFAALGLAGLVAGRAFFQNVLPLGRSGQLLSGGTIPLGNLTVGLEVMGALLLVFSEFLEQALLLRRRS